MANDLREIWQQQETEARTMSVEDVRRKASELEKTIRRRNLREYIASAFVLVFFGIHAALAEETFARLGHSLVVAGTIFVVYQLHRRGSASPLPAELAFGPGRDFHRAELERQRDLLRGVWTWYLLPFVPGLAVLLGGTGSTRALVFGAFCGVLFLIIGAVNTYAARELEREIRKLSEAEEKT